MSNGADPFLTLIRTEPRAVLATLVGATGGGASKKLGAAMWVGASGRVLGGVTIGGCVDSRVLATTNDVLVSGHNQLLNLALDDDEAWDLGLTCGGTVQVCLEPVGGFPAHALDALGARELTASLVASGRSAVSAFALDGSGMRLVVADGELVAGTLGDPELDRNAVRVARAVAERGSAGVEAVLGASGSHDVFFEPHAPPCTLVIVGASDVAISLAALARELGMRSVVVDGRERYATHERFPRADEVHVGMPSEIVVRFVENPNAAIVLVAHDYKYELPVLRAVLRSRVGYIGMLGSRRRGNGIRQMLREEGFTNAELARIHTPIGVNIGAESPAEIALAIAAEVVAVRNGKQQ